MPINSIEYGFLFVFAAVFFLIGRISNRCIPRNKRTLQESEGQYASLIQLAPDPIIVLDNLGFLRSINLAAEEASLYRANELVGKHFMATGVIAALSMPKVVQEFERAVSGEKGPPFEVEIIQKFTRCSK